MYFADTKSRETILTLTAFGLFAIYDVFTIFGEKVGKFIVHLGVIGRFVKVVQVVMDTLVLDGVRNVIRESG